MSPFYHTDIEMLEFILEFIRGVLISISFVIFLPYLGRKIEKKRKRKGNLEKKLNSIDEKLNKLESRLDDKCNNS